MRKEKNKEVLWENIFIFIQKKAPEYGIKKIKVLDEEYTINSKGKYLNAIYSNFNIHNYIEDDYNSCYIELYQPFKDKEIYCNDEHGFRNSLIFSYNLSKLKEWHKEEFDFVYKSLKNRINFFERIMDENEKNTL